MRHSRGHGSFIFATALGALAAASAGAAPYRPVRVEELARCGRVGDVAVSPDGKQVVFVVATPDVEANTSHSALWMVPAAGGEARRLTSGDHKDTMPRFAPDGRRLAFISDRERGAQIWTLELAGGDPMRATAFPTEVNGFTWTPDGKSFVVASDVFPECADAACLERIVKARQTAKVKGRIVDRLLFRHWDAWKDGTRTHLWRVPARPDGGAPVDLTPGDHDTPPFAIGGGDDWDVSRDGRDLVYASNHDKVEALSTNADVWIVSTSGGTARNLTAGNPAYDGAPRFSPDGKWIAYRAQKRPGFESDRFELMVMDRATGRARSLTSSLDTWVEAYRWAPDSSALYFIAERRGRGALYRVAIGGGAPAEIWTGGTPASLEVSAQGPVIMAVSALNRPAEVWRVDADGKNPRALSHVNDALVAELAFGDVSERFTDSADGRKLQAFLVKPPHFDPAKKYPAVFLIHGGPQGAWLDAWSYRWNPEVWAAYGYVVYAANPRGSTGFGQDFVDAISGDWGGGVYDDLMRQADDLESLPFVDKKRIGAAGASYGGYMINWILGHTQRFAALVSHDGTFDSISHTLETEELWFPTWEFKGWPWNSELYEKWNPVRFAKNFKTPTLVIQSERDYRVPLSQGLQLFTTLQVQGVPSRLLTFPDEGHWVLKPGDSWLWHNVVMDWLHKWLGGDEADPKALESAYSWTR